MAFNSIKRPGAAGDTPSPVEQPGAVQPAGRGPVAQAAQGDGGPGGPGRPGKTAESWRRIIKRPGGGEQPAAEAQPRAPGYAAPTHRPELGSQAAHAPQPTPDNVRICPSCGAAHPLDAQVCRRCHTALGRRTRAPLLAQSPRSAPAAKGGKLCPKCKTSNRPEELFCRKCARPLPTVDPDAKKRGGPLRLVLLALISVALLLVIGAVVLASPGPAATSSAAAPLVTATAVPADFTATALAVEAHTTAVARETAVALYLSDVGSLLARLAERDTVLLGTLEQVDRAQVDYAEASAQLAGFVKEAEDLRRDLRRLAAPAERQGDLTVLNRALDHRDLALDNGRQYIDALSELTTTTRLADQAKALYDQAQATYDASGGQQGFAELTRARIEYEGLAAKLDRLRTRAAQAGRQLKLEWEAYVKDLDAVKERLNAAPTSTPAPSEEGSAGGEAGAIYSRAGAGASLS